jgi:hypothetical protein
MKQNQEEVKIVYVDRYLVQHLPHVNKIDRNVQTDYVDEQNFRSRQSRN